MPSEPKHCCEITHFLLYIITFYLFLEFEVSEIKKLKGTYFYGPGNYFFDRIVLLWFNILFLGGGLTYLVTLKYRK